MNIQVCDRKHYNCTALGLCLTTTSAKEARQHRCMQQEFFLQIACK
jgi:hypothetical protein